MVTVKLGGGRSDDDGDTLPPDGRSPVYCDRDRAPFISARAVPIVQKSIPRGGGMMRQFARSVVVGMLLTGLTGATALEGHLQENQEAPKDKKVVRYTMPLPFQPSDYWSGYVLDIKLKRTAPEVVGDAETLRKLWKTWNGDRELPKVNFKEEVLFVFTSLGPNIPCLNLYLCGENVCGTVAHTCKGGPGFGYRIVKVSRKEIKSFFGRPIE
jgi:hypothetical protein